MDFLCVLCVRARVFFGIPGSERLEALARLSGEPQRSSPGTPGVSATDLAHDLQISPARVREQLIAFVAAGVLGSRTKGALDLLLPTPAADAACCSARR